MPMIVARRTARRIAFRVKVWTLFALLGIVLALSSGCAAKSPTVPETQIGSGEHPAGATLLTMLLADNLIVSKETTLGLLRQFEARNPDLRVRLETVPSAQLNERMKIRVATGDMPDLYQLQVSSDVAGLAHKAGYVYDLSSLEASRAFPEKVRNQLIREGILMDFPLGLGVLGFLYNKELLAEAGFDGPPESWEELMSLGRELQGKGKALLVYSGKWSTGIGQVFHWTFGNRALRDAAFEQQYKSGEIDFGEAANRALLAEGFARFAELNAFVLTGSFTNEVEQARQAFVEGRAALLLGGTWDAGATDKLVPGFEWGFMNLPYSEEPNSVVHIVEGGIAINAQSPRLDAATRLLEFLFSPEIYSQIVAAKKSLSAIPGLGSVDPRFKPAAEGLNSGRVMPFANGGPMPPPLFIQLGQLAQGASANSDFAGAIETFIREYEAQ